MYIEKLTKEEILNISKQLLSIVESDECKVNAKIQSAAISASKANTTLTFKSIYNFQHISLSDFNAEISYGYHNDKEIINKTYRKFMYNKFGNQYKQDFETEYKKSIEKKYREELDSLQEEIDAFPK